MSCASIRVLVTFSMALCTLCDDTESCLTRCMGLHHLLPLSRQLSQYCSRPWAIRQLTVQDAIRHRICQYRHGFSCACSAALMDDTLTIISLKPVKMVTQLNRKSPRAPGKSGHHSVPGRKQEVSGVVHSARPCVICQHSPWLHVISRS